MSSVGLADTTLTILNTAGEHTRPKNTLEHCGHKTQLVDVTDEPILGRRTIRLFFILLFKILVVRKY